MKKVSRMVLVGVLATCMMSGVLGMALAKSTNITCDVVAKSTNDDISVVLINCAPNVPIKKGDKIKVKVQNDKTSQIEGC